MVLLLCLPQSFQIEMPIKCWFATQNIILSNQKYELNVCLLPWFFNP